MKDAILFPADHLRLLVQFHLDTTPDNEPLEDPQPIVSMLWQANREAVALRCGEGVLCLTEEAAPEFEPVVLATLPVPVLKALEGFEDQVGDLPDFRQSKAGRWCRQLRRRALAEMTEGWPFPDDAWIFQP